MNLPRLQLVELEDQSWFPRRVRDLGTDYLRYVEGRFRLYRLALPILEKALRECGAHHVVDLCSGGGGPVPDLVRELEASGTDVRFVLTDLYPNLEAFRKAEKEGNGHIGFVEHPVDARQVPDEFRGLRTFFNAFHHFAPRDAQAILRSAAESRQPIAVLEVPQRSLLSILSLLLTPLPVWLATPFIRPFSWWRIALTYFVPAVPLLCVWDGVVSQFRAYHPEELEVLAEGVGVDGYVWEAGTYKAASVPGRLTYLLGRPVEHP